MSSADVKDARKQSIEQYVPAKFKLGQRHNLLHEGCMAATHTTRDGRKRELEACNTHQTSRWGGFGCVSG